MDGKENTNDAQESVFDRIEEEIGGFGEKRVAHLREEFSDEELRSALEETYMTGDTAPLERATLIGSGYAKKAARWWGSEEVEEEAALEARRVRYVLDNFPEYIQQTREPILNIREFTRQWTDCIIEIVEEGVYYPSKEVTANFGLSWEERLQGTKKIELTPYFSLGMVFGIALEQDISTHSDLEEKWQEGRFTLPSSVDVREDIVGETADTELMEVVTQSHLHVDEEVQARQVRKQLNRVNRVLSAGDEGGERVPEELVSGFEEWVRAVIEQGTLYPDVTMEREVSLTWKERVRGKMAWSVRDLIMRGVIIGSAFERDIPSGCDAGGTLPDSNSRYLGQDIWARDVKGNELNFERSQEG